MLHLKTQPWYYASFDLQVELRFDIIDSLKYKVKSGLCVIDPLTLIINL